ncbi:MAG: hypothetical protein GXY88_08915 [Tissierellia bacterium]|nr:hypothetical protein [Tissierellia bacterium]
MANEKITIGQNLKRIREELGLKQYEIAGNEVTRNLISLIENDKTPIYYNVAHIIAKNINKTINKKGIQIYIQPEDILNPGRYEARKQANKYIEKLQKHLNDSDYEIEIEELNEIENFLNKWNLIDKKIKTYELLGDIYYKAKDLNREYYYYLKALEVSFEFPGMKDRYKIILKLVSNCILTKKFEEAIKLCNFALSTQEDISNKYKGVFYFNSGLAYYHKGEYGKCLDQLIRAKFYINYNDYREMKRILILEGICNLELKNFDCAVRNYNKLLELIDEKGNFEEMCLAYINLVQLYIEMDHKEEVIKYHQKVMDCLPHIDKNSFYLPEILLSISNTYYYLKEYGGCAEYLNKALSLSEELINLSVFTKTFSNLIDLYTELGWLDKIDDLARKFQRQICDFKLDENFSIILKILYNFIEQGNSEEAKFFINNLLNKRG